MKPILFNTEMVRAIIAGRKTQTRRIIKPQPVLAAMAAHTQKNFEAVSSILGIGAQNDTAFQWHINGCAYIDFPKGFGTFAKHQRGDILYVRETFMDMTEYPCADYHEDPENAPRFIYRADVPEGTDISHLTWRPSIHMPAEAARLFLRITDVRVERLNEISEEDAIAEGVGAGFQMNAGWPDYTRIVNGVCELTQDTAALSFQTLWDSIYGTPSPVKGDENEVVGYVVYPWNDEEAKQFGATYRGKPLEVFVNPWVWVYDFERIEKP